MNSQVGEIGDVIIVDPPHTEDIGVGINRLFKEHENRISMQRFQKELERMFGFPPYVVLRGNELFSRGTTMGYLRQSGFLIYPIEDGFVCNAQNPIRDDSDIIAL